MTIPNSLIDLIISRCTIEYNGTHAPWSQEHGNNGLYGRHAYWRVFVPGIGFCCKITAPVKSINPKQKTLDKLLRAELRKRIEAIQEHVETDHYGQLYIAMRDPYSVRRLVESIDKAYVTMGDNGLVIRFFGTGSKAADTTLALEASNE